MPEWITSRANAKVKALAELGQRKARREQGVTLAEGLHLVSEAFAAKAPIAALIIARRAAGIEAVAALENEAYKRGIEIVHLDDGCYDKISELESPEGVAVTVSIAEAPLAALLTSSARLLVAAGVQDPGNAGALVRTAEAAGASGCVFLGGIDLSHPRFLRGAQGSTFRLPCSSALPPDFLKALAATRIRLLAAQMREGVDYLSADYTPPVAILVGGEGQGIPDSLLAAAKARLLIPMTPPVESLNVAVAAGILLYEARKHWR